MPDSTSPIVHTSLVAVDTIARLTHLAAQDGDLALVSGYHESGDGGGQWFRWDAASTAAPNGGTVFEGKRTRRRTGRWLALHDGRVDFAHFGIMDSTIAADDAFDAMLGDPSIHTITISSPLTFRRSHALGRSGVRLLGGGHPLLIEVDSAETASFLHIRGRTTGSEHTVTLGATVPELTDILPISSAAALEVGQWWRVQGSGTAEHRIDQLVEVTQTYTSAQVRVSGKTGWELPAGSTLQWTEVQPVRDTIITQLNFRSGSADVPDLPLIAFSDAADTAVRQLSSNLAATAVVSFNHATRFDVTQTDVTLPAAAATSAAARVVTISGGLFGAIRECTAHHASLIRLTSSAHCAVENTHASAGDLVAVMFQGQGEHDITLTGVTGSVSVNQETSTSTGVRRVSLSNVTGARISAVSLVSELTLHAVHALALTGVENSGRMDLSSDGLIMRGCTAVGLRLSAGPGRARRPAAISGSSFTLAGLSGAGADPLTRRLIMRDSRILLSQDLDSDYAAALVWERCSIRPGNGSPQTELRLGAATVEMTQCELQDVTLNLAATAPQRLTIDGGSTISGPAGGASLLRRSASNHLVIWELQHSQFTHSGQHLELAGESNQVSIDRCSFTGGSLTFTDQTLAAADAHALICNNTERSVSVDFPDHPRILLGHRLIVT